MLRASHLLFFAAALTLISPAQAIAKSMAKKTNPKKDAPQFDKWYQTNDIESFPCMDEKETNFLKVILTMKKIEEKNILLTSHRKQVRPSLRSPASVTPSQFVNHNFICPPYKGVRNPYPEVVDFGKAAPFERIHFNENSVDVINGLSKNEKWPMTYISSKGYYEGQNPRGTPLNIIPIPSNKTKEVRFIVQYMVWKDNTPPALTICYREDLHNKCNPYMNPALKPTGAPGAQDRSPASTAKPQSPTAANSKS